VGLKKGPWTPEEDQKLLAYVEEHGHGSWRALPAKAGDYINKPFLFFFQIMSRLGIKRYFRCYLFLLFFGLHIYRASKMREEL
jgi:hypothetical protein